VVIRSGFFKQKPPEQSADGKINGYLARSLFSN